MKKLLSLCLLLQTGVLFSQSLGQAIDYALADISKFGENYVNPAAKGVMYNVNNAWYNDAKTIGFLDFELGVVSNVTFVKRDEASFTMNVNDYQNIRFQDEVQQKQIATIFGVNDPAATVLIGYDDLNGENQQIAIELPQGIDDENVDMVPNVFLQAGFGVYEGTEVKLRFAPRLDYGNIEKSTLGVAVQHEFTSWLQNDFPVTISGLVGYSRFDGFFDVKEPSVQDENQGIDTQMNSWTFSVLASKSVNDFSFYAAVNHMQAKAETQFNGVYDFGEEYAQFRHFLDDFTVINNVSGWGGTIGANYTFANLKVHAAYNIQEFSNLNLGVFYHFD